MGAETIEAGLSFAVHFVHRLRFTRDVFDPANEVLASCFPTDGGRPGRVLTFVDTQVAHHWPALADRLHGYAAAHRDRFELAGEVEPVPGGERCKNDRDAMDRVLHAIDRARLDRHSYVLAVGGGAVLDCVGFAAAIAHRGVRLIRLPTTTLSQADSGAGVKNGINGFGKKNALGAFAVPWTVINDERFLTTLSDRDWRGGFSEAVKVALVKDASLFEQIERSAAAIAARDMATATPVIQRSAELHCAHITGGGDPFKLTTARPLDAGHWSAHKLEVMSDFSLRHGDAVAIGLALDALYAQHVGLLGAAAAQRILTCLRELGFKLDHEQLRNTDALLAGLEEFREHLGGRLTVTLLRGIGEPIDVHQIDPAAVRAAAAELADCGKSIETADERR